MPSSRTQQLRQRYEKLLRKQRTEQEEILEKVPVTTEELAIMTETVPREEVSPSLKEDSESESFRWEISTQSIVFMAAWQYCQVHTSRGAKLEEIVKSFNFSSDTASLQYLELLAAIEEIYQE